MIYVGSEWVQKDPRPGPALPPALIALVLSQPPVGLPRSLTAPVQRGRGEEGSNQPVLQPDKRLDE